MRWPVLVAVLVVLLAGAEARAPRYHEKTRFDRSVSNEYPRDSRIQTVTSKKPRIFTDAETHYTAYRDGGQSVCYLEKLKSGDSDDTKLWRDVVQNNKRAIYASERSLTKIEAWRLAGGRVVEFCHGMTFILLQDTKPAEAENADDPFYNELPEDENDIVQKRVADVVLRPLRLRAKRQAAAEEAEFARRKREAGAYRGGGRFRGQTQSQYLNVGDKEGKAEAEASQHASRAVVSGSSGMGQAQSMSSGSDGCDGCPGYDKSVPQAIPGIIGSQPGVTTGGVPVTYPGGTRPGTVMFPGGTPGSQTVGGAGPGMQTPGGTDIPGYVPGTLMGTGQGVPIPGVSYPGGTIPGTQAGGTLVGTGQGVPIPGVSYPGGTVPGTQGTGTVVGTQPGTQVTSGGTTPGTVPGVSGPQTPGTLPYPPNYYTGVAGPPAQGTTNIPGGQTPRGVIYQPGTSASGQGSQTPPGVLYHPLSQVPGGGTGGGPGVQYPGYPSGSQMQGGGGSGTQPPAVVYQPGTQVGGGGTGQGVSTPGGVIYQPGTQGGITAPGVQLSSGFVYTPGTQSGGVSPGVSYPSGLPTMRGGGPGSQSSVGAILYQPGPPAGTGVPGVQYPVGTIYPPGTQVGGGGPETQTGSGSGVQYLNGGSGSQYPGGTVYSPGMQPIGGIPGAQTPGIVYQPGMPTGRGSGGPGVQTPGAVSYTPGPQIGSSKPVVQTPGVVYQPGMQVGSGGPGVQTPGAVSYTPTTQTGSDGGTGNVYQPGTQGPSAYIPATQAGGVTVSTQGSAGVVYQPGMQIGGSSPGTITTGATYAPGTQFIGTGAPGTSIPVTQVNGGGNQVTGSNQLPVGSIYSPGTQIPTGVIYTPGTQSPPVGVGSGVQTGVAYPPSTQMTGGVYPPGTQIVNGVPYPSGPQVGGTTYVPGTQVGGGVYPPGTQMTNGGVYSPRTVPGTQGGVSGVYRPDALTPGQISGGGQVTQTGTTSGNQGPPGVLIPGIMPGTQYPGGVIPGAQIPGGVSSTNTGIYPGQLPGGVTGPPLTGPLVTGGEPKPVMRGDIPGIVAYPTSQQTGPQTGTGGGVPGILPSGYPGLLPGQYPGTGNVLMPEQGQGPVTGYPGSTGIVGGGGSAQTVAPEVSGQQVVGGTVNAAADDGSDSQAISSVTQGEAGTQASASAEGRHGQGSAKSQVTGTYNGSGSFSAQAGTSDNTKSAQTQVSGGKDGAKSSAQGSGGLGKSQTQVDLDSNSGATSTNAQSSGWNHGTNSQVQASSKGGMADAQANGEGQTSSQAQIGFQPYVSNYKEKPAQERREKPFRGGGTASAQSGTFRGQSQSQLQGSFHYGITYTGAAQAGSGSGAAALRKPFNFSNADSELFKPFKLETTTTDAPGDQLQAESSNARQTVIAISQRNSQDKKHNRPDRPPYETSVDDYEEYEDEEYADRQTTIASAARQTMRVVTDGEFDVSVRQEEHAEELSTSRSLPGYVAPSSAGHHSRTMKVTSVAGRKTIAQGDRSQSQTVTIVPATSRLASSSTTSRAASDTRSLKPVVVASSTLAPKTNYVSVANSVAGKIEDKNPPGKKYEHRYYTKSSTCGYFTFSCNVVYGANGRRKICKPKMPTYADGTPKC